MLVLIICNCTTIGIQSMKQMRRDYGFALDGIDNILLGMFITEAVIRMIPMRLRYFYDGWNVFDFVMILISFGVLIQQEMAADPNAVTAGRLFYFIRILRAFRSVRVFRAFKSLSAVKSLQMIVKTLFQSVVALASISLTGALILCTLFNLDAWAVIGTCYYGSVSADFSSVWKTSFRLIRVISLDTWTEYYYNLSSQAPTLSLYLILFVIIQSYVFLNLLTAVIVNNLVSSKDHRERKKPKTANLVIYIYLGQFFG